MHTIQRLPWSKCKTQPQCLLYKENSKFLLMMLCSMLLMDLHWTSVHYSSEHKLNYNGGTNLIQVTGRALNAQKCCGLIYSWELDKRGILQLAQPDQMQQIIVLKDGQTQEPILILSLQEGTRYLGLYVTIDQNTAPLEAHLWKKAMLYTYAFHWTPMTQWEAGVLYCSCFLPALTYPFPAAWLPDKFFKKVHYLSTSTILNKMGYHCNLLHCMVFAPHKYGGVGLCHLQHEMEIQ